MLCFKDLYTYLKDVFQLLVHYPNGHNGQVEAGSFLQIPLLYGRQWPKNLGQLFHCFSLVSSRELAQKVAQEHVTEQ